MTHDDEIWVLATLLRRARRAPNTEQTALTPEVYARHILGVSLEESGAIRLGLLAITPLSEVLS